MNKKRNTLQRQIILDTLKSLDAHPSAEELYVKIRKTHPVVGKSTVYRNLRQLAEDGVIAQSVMNGVVRYDKQSSAHYHFICDVCGKIFDIDIDHDNSFHDMILSKYGFKASRHEIGFFGVCSDCDAAN